MKTTFLKRFLFLTSFLITILSTLGAQPRQGQGNWQQRYQQLESQRIAFITKELSLTPQEAQVFWPVYNEYNSNRNQMMLKHRNNRSQDVNLEQLSEKELMEIADTDVLNTEEMAALRREYHVKFKQVLPIKKVVQLYNAERDFNRHLYQEGRGGRQGRGQN